MEAIAKYFLLPSGMILTLVILGFILVFAKKSKKIGLYLLLSAGILYVFFGTGPVSFWLLGNLEYQYPHLGNQKAFAKVNTIVVLAAHAEQDVNRPISSNVNSSTAFSNVLVDSSSMTILLSGNPNAQRTFLINSGTSL